MKIKTILVSTLAVTAVATTTQSCLAIATSSIGLSILKKVLLGGITRGLGIFNNKQAFLENDLILKALPDNLRSTYNVLDKIAPQQTAKAKEYVAETAAYTVNTAQPILTNAVNSLTAEDVEKVAHGGAGAATRLLKEKTAHQLAMALLPKVDEKLNQYGIVKTLNSTLSGNSFMGALLGNSRAGENDKVISRLVSEQMVNGLFYIIEDYEKKNTMQLTNALK